MEHDLDIISEGVGDDAPSTPEEEQTENDRKHILRNSAWLPHPHEQTSDKSQPNATPNASATETMAFGPTNPLVLDPAIVHPLERIGCSEFFTTIGKNKVQLANKTPERYLKIRNTIIDAYIRCKPKRISKSAIRPLLKGHGDVHAISRVHEFLEGVGCINVEYCNSEQKTKADKTAAPSSLAGSKNDPSIILKGESRKRKVRNKMGEWVDPSDLRDGRVIVHGEDGRALSDDGEEFQTAEELAEEKRMLLKNAKYFADEELLKVDPELVKRKKRQIQRQYYHYGNDFEDEEMNAFRLIPVEHYKADNPELQPPFSVIVDATVHLVIDFHSHLSETEIIGLLGGNYDPDTRVLHINEVFPCKSISTSIQCEMDPESEVKATVHFAQKSKHVVGWYHSHPTFDPNPSIRDIETQTDHQHLFLRQEDGIEPFVGAIYTPYDSRVEGVASRCEWICVSQTVAQGGKYRVPYACEYEIRPTQGIPIDIEDQIWKLIEEFQLSSARFDLRQSYKPATTRLEKLIGATQLNAFSCIDFAAENVAEVTLNAENFVSRVQEKLNHIILK